MKKLSSGIGTVFFLCFSYFANAYLVRDVVTFNQALGAGDFVTWTHDLTAYGYVPEGNHTSLDFTLTLELRDISEYPSEESSEGEMDRPFYRLSQGHGFGHGRLGDSDLVITPSGTPIHVDMFGKVSPWLTIESGSVWFGSAIFIVDIPSTSVPEPTPILLFGFGLLALALQRRRTRNI